MQYKQYHLLNNIIVMYYFSKRGHSVEKYKTASIVELVKLHLSGTKIFPENIDIVTGGFPCQDFSVAGKRKGFNSHRNHLGKLNTENFEFDWTVMTSFINNVNPFRLIDSKLSLEVNATK